MFVLKRTEVIVVRETYQGRLLVTLANILRFLGGNALENPKQNHNGETDFSQKKF